MQPKLIEITRDDKIVAQLNKDLLAIQKTKNLMIGASLFRPQGPLFDKSQDSAQVQESLFD